MFRVKCPVCGGFLTIDERLKRVVGHRSKEEADKSLGEQFDTLLGSVAQAKARQAERLAEAKERESQRKSHVDDLFKKAQDKAKEAGDDDKPVGPAW